VAAGNGCLVAVNALVAAASLDVEDASGRTPFSLAIGARQEAVAVALMKAGAKAEFRESATPLLIVAFELALYEPMEGLLGRGGDGGAVLARAVRKPTFGVLARIA
jgi:ankyrin repeat protein